MGLLTTGIFYRRLRGILYGLNTLNILIIQVKEESAGLVEVHDKNTEKSS